MLSRDTALYRKMQNRLRLRWQLNSTAEIGRMRAEPSVHIHDVGQILYWSITERVISRCFRARKTHAHRK
jgi:hypothetical protein